MAGATSSPQGNAQYEDLDVVRTAGVLTVTIMRADKRNALRAQTMVELCEVLERAKTYCNCSSS